MPFVSAGPGGNTNHPTGGIAVLRIEVIADHAKLLRGVRVGKWTGSLKVIIHVRDAVQLVKNAADAAAVYNSGRLIWRTAAHTGQRRSTGLRGVNSTRR